MECCRVASEKIGLLYLNTTCDKTLIRLRLLRVGSVPFVLNYELGVKLPRQPKYNF